MKKGLFLIASMCFFSISILNAQFSQGKFLLGISSSSNLFSLYEGYSGGSSNLMHLGFSSMKYKSDSDEGDAEKIRTFNLSPRAGYFIIDNLTAGLDINLSVMSFGTGEDKESMTALGFGPFLRYYIPFEKIAPFFELGGSLGSLRNKYTNWNDDEVTEKSSIKSFTGGIGLALPVSETVKFDIMGGYVSTVMKDKEDNPEDVRIILNTVGFKFGFLILLGANL